VRSLSFCGLEIKHESALCQGKIEMSPSRQSRNVAFGLGHWRVPVILRLPVKRRRALVATNLLEE